jgi:anti-anti-sigma regulatory factor
VAKTIRASKGAKSLKLSGDLRIAGAATAFRLLRRAAEGAERHLALDAQQVEKVDAAGLQAILAGRQALQRAGKSVTWARCSVQLTAAAELLGLSEALELPK